MKWSVLSSLAGSLLLLGAQGCSITDSSPSDGAAPAGTVDGGSEDAGSVWNLPPAPDMTLRPLPTGFVDFRTSRVVSMDFSAGRPTLVDLNKDGAPELIAVDYGSPLIRVFRNLGRGFFGNSTDYEKNYDVRRILGGDLDGDGNNDLIGLYGAGGASSSQVTVMRGNGSGSFLSTTRFPLPTLPSNEGALADTNGDGALDVITFARTEATGYTLLNDKSGGLGTAQPFVIAFTPDYLATADVNKDGRTDLIYTSRTTGQVAVQLMNPAGGFLSPVLYKTGTQPYGVAVVDANGDGKKDLAVVNSLDRSFSVYLGDGAGGFTALPAEPAGACVLTLEAADLDKDGKEDLISVCASYEEDSVALFRGTGTGRFGFTAAFAAPLASFRTQVADLDQDGSLDIVASGPVDIASLINDGTGRFAPAARVSDGGAAQGVLTLDVNQDGNPDVLAATDRGVSVWLANGGGGLGAPSTFPTLPSPRALKAGDVNGN